MLSFDEMFLRSEILRHLGADIESSGDKLEQSADFAYCDLTNFLFAKFHLLLAQAKLIKNSGIRPEYTNF